MRLHESLLMREVKNNSFVSPAEFWERRLGRALSEEDTRKIAENMTGFFTVLLEWETSDSQEQTAEGDATYYAKSA